MLKFDEPNSFPPKVDASLRKLGIKTPYQMLLIPHLVVFMVAISRGIFRPWEWIVYAITLALLYILLFTDESGIMMITMIREALFSVFRNKTFDYVYQPEEEFAVFEWQIKDIKND
ncbi:hypothetical protein LLE49_19870 [Alicyclobacillus tolerans]|uniref:hypothetical protein n=1 Tax=Alicyclobacillus tolerans TaxID=90970 RepID=UPI001F24724C|nr:hypothetical protein [Alicyclobacillus tolerans]MCF8566982.1 hypothetical protein [Alicyclobacillus tolerans]